MYKFNTFISIDKYDAYTRALAEHGINFERVGMTLLHQSIVKESFPEIEVGNCRRLLIYTNNLEETRAIIKQIKSEI